MTWVRPKPAWLIIATYGVVAIGLGIALPSWKAFAAARFGRPGLGNFYIVNIAMPLLIASLTAWYPRLRVALAGTLLAEMIFLLSLGLRPAGAPSRWAASTVSQLDPIVTIACVGYIVIAIAVVAMLRPFRRVGIPPDPDACKVCGYLLRERSSVRCPECGTPIAPASSRAT